MDGQTLVDSLRARLRGRSKRELIEGMIVRSPHPAATEKMVLALDPFPHVFLMLAHDYPTKIWILDRGERPSSAEILGHEARARRWHSSGLRVDDCEGVTDVVAGSIAVVVSWRTLLVMRHEFAHAITTFLSGKSRHQFRRLFAEAAQEGRFLEPLASESIGEYVACGLSYYFFDDLRARLLAVDADLHDAVQEVFHQAGSLSARITENPQIPTMP